MKDLEEPFTEAEQIALGEVGQYKLSDLSLTHVLCLYECMKQSHPATVGLDVFDSMFTTITALAKNKWLEHLENLGEIKLLQPWEPDPDVSVPENIHIVDGIDPSTIR